MTTDTTSDPAGPQNPQNWWLPNISYKQPLAFLDPNAPGFCWDMATVRAVNTSAQEFMRLLIGSNSSAAIIGPPGHWKISGHD